MRFTDWFHLQKILKTKDGNDIELWSFDYDILDATVMSEWARLFRNNYCLDSYLDMYRSGRNLSRKEFLIQNVFPDKTNYFGPATRSGDFSEILIADFLEYIENYWIPSRIRYENKPTKNSSTPGSDVVAIKFVDDSLANPQDELLVVETKGKYTGKNAKKQLFEIIGLPERELENRLQDAVDDSNKDPTRLGEFLNFAKVRFVNCGKIEESKKIERFQDEFGKPYNKKFGAAAFFDKVVYDDAFVLKTDCSEHSCKQKMRLLVVTGNDMMKLIHHLYEKAADEA